MNERERRTSKEEERTRLHHPPFPKQRQLGQTGKVKPGMAWHGMEEEEKEEKEAVKQPIISHLLLIPLPPSGVTIATDAEEASSANTTEIVVAGAAVSGRPGLTAGNIMVTRVGGRGGGQTLHNNELGSPEFRVATVSTSLKNVLISIGAVSDNKNMFKNDKSNTRLDHDRQALITAAAAEKIGIWYAGHGRRYGQAVQEVSHMALTQLSHARARASTPCLKPQPIKTL